MDKLNFSVVIPYYNDLMGLERAVDSVLSQSKVECVKEIIIIDDFSHIYPLTFEIQQNLKTKSSLKNVDILFFRLNKNQGPGNARNIGIEKSRSKFVCLLDSDEFWYKSKIEDVFNSIQYINANKEEFVLLGHKRTIVSKTNLEKSLKIDSHINKKPVRLNTIQLLIRNPLPTSSLVINKEQYDVNFNHDIRYSEDYRFILQNTLISKKNAYILKKELVFTDKHYYAESGLGSNLKKMQRGEVDNYLMLIKSDVNLIIKSLLPLIILFSYLKYIKRNLITIIYKIIHS